MLVVENKPAVAPWSKIPGETYYFDFGPIRESRKYDANGDKSVWYSQYIRPDSPRNEDGAYGWVADLKGIKERPLYQRNKLKDSPAGVEVFIPGGPPKVDLLIQVFGVLATTNPCGEMAWRKVPADELELLRDKHVIILPDNDRTGRRFVEHVGRSLTGIAASIKVVQLPSLPDGGDVVDWHEMGGTPERFRRLVDAAPHYTPGADAEQPRYEDEELEQYERFVLALEEADCEPDEETGVARCPCGWNHANGDANPSLAFGRGDTQPLICYCRAGCSFGEIQAALGLTFECIPLPPEDDKPLLLDRVLESIWDGTLPKREDWRMMGLEGRYKEMNRRVFNLCRHLKCGFSLPRDTVDVGRFVRAWCKLAVEEIGNEAEATPDWVWGELLRVWPKAQHSMFSGPLVERFERAEASPYPAWAEKHKNNKVRELARLCEQSQRDAGPNNPWFLATRSAGMLTGMSHNTVAGFLRVFVRDGVIRRATKDETPASGRGRSGRVAPYYWLTANLANIT